MVILEGKTKDDGDGAVERRYALLPEDTDFYQILTNAGVDIKELEMTSMNLGLALHLEIY